MMAGRAHDTERTRYRSRVRRADLRAVPQTRHALRRLLEHWGKPGRSDTAELLATELVTNALVHTDGDALVTATVTPDLLYVEVRDFAPRVPMPRAPSPDVGTSGRGLMLVQLLADAWGIRGQGGEQGDEAGKVVWFELDAGGG
jgi:anti-sigma regulatory factor (Ser/Thr protein kinase)